MRAIRSTTARALVRDGQVLANHRKVALPNYAVFDEKRYFHAGDARDRRRSRRRQARPDHLRGRLGACPLPRACGRRRRGSFSSSTARRSTVRSSRRARRCSRCARRKTRCRSIYVNMVGGQDELVFDGGSVVVDATGEVQFRAPLFEEGALHRRPRAQGDRLAPRAAAVTPVPPLAERVYRALVLGTRDYVEKNGFTGVVLGLSGGVDSALDARRSPSTRSAPERVHAVMMPSRFTSQMSREDAARASGGAWRSLRRAVDRADVRHDVGVLEDVFAGLPPTRPKRTSRHAAAACC